MKRCNLGKYKQAPTQQIQKRLRPLRWNPSLRGFRMVDCYLPPSLFFWKKLIGIKALGWAEHLDWVIWSPGSPLFTPLKRQCPSQAGKSSFKVADFWTIFLPTYLGRYSPYRQYLFRTLFFFSFFKMNKLVRTIYKGPDAFVGPVLLFSFIW